MRSIDEGGGGDRLTREAGEGEIDEGGTQLHVLAIRVMSLKVYGAREWWWMVSRGRGH